MKLTHFTLYLLLVFTAVPAIANQPPVLDSIGPKTAIVDKQLSFEIRASDPDGSPPYLFAANVPSGASFGGFTIDTNNTNTRIGTFQWTPDSSQVGVYYVTFYTCDVEFCDTEIVAIDVKEAGYDPGVKDTLELVVTLQPDAASSQFHVELSLYAFSDSTIIGAAAGFTWDNPNLRLDSAVASSLVSSGFGIGPSFYEQDNIDTANSYQRFIFLGTYYPPDSSYGIPGDPNGRHLWAIYYFTLSNWSANDSIVIDTTLVPPSTELIFTVPDYYLNQISFVPYWKGPVIIRDASTDVTEIGGSNVPTTYSLNQNYPNPFNPTTEISFEVPVQSHVTLTVYNILGQRVTSLVNQELAPGSYVVEWNGTADNGQHVASGIYFYRLEAKDFIQTKKMMLLK